MTSPASAAQNAARSARRSAVYSFSQPAFCVQQAVSEGATAQVDLPVKVPAFVPPPGGLPPPPEGPGGPGGPGRPGGP